MPFKKLIYSMLTSVKASTQNALERYFEKTDEDVFMTQQSFSEARQKLNVSAFIELFVMTVKLAYEGYYKTWHGYRVMAVDGTKLALPSDELLRNHYGTAGAGNTSVTARGSILYDPLNKVVVDAERAGKANKYQYQINVNHEIGVLKDRLILAFLEDDDKKRAKQVQKILWLLTKRVSPVRPNRSVARKSSSRDSKFHHNQKSNC